MEKRGAHRLRRLSTSRTIYSDDGACSFGVTGDYDATPDIDVLCEGIEGSMSELLDLARSGPRSGRTREPARGGRRGAARAAS
jgi:hypothetical protein